MKTKKKVLIIAMAALLLVGTIAGTMAWLYDQDIGDDQVFVIGDIHIDLNDTSLADALTEVTDGAGNGAHTNNVLVPGKGYTLNPTVNVEADSEDCFVRVLMVIGNADDVVATMGTTKVSDCIDLQEGWTIVDNDNGDLTFDDLPAYTNHGKADDANQVYVELRKTDIVEKSANESAALIPFTTFTLPNYLNNDDIKMLMADHDKTNSEENGKLDNNAGTDAFDIKFVAEAIQSDYIAGNGASNVGTIDAAWNAFDEQINGESGDALYQPNRADGDARLYTTGD